MSFRIAVIYGSVRTNRQGIRAVRYMINRLRERGHAVTLIDPMEAKFPMLDRMYKEYEKGKAPEVIEKTAGVFAEADGFLVVSGEYNHSLPPALKNVLDHFQKEYFFKPSAIVTYSTGNFGGVRSAFQLRTILAELGAPSISSTIPVPKVQDAFREDGAPNDDAWDRRSRRFIDEFEWYLRAFKTEREKGTPY